MELQARVRVWGRPRGRSGMRAPRVSSKYLVREDARVGAGSEMHDTLFRTGSAVVNPEGEAPSTAVGEHESITTVGLVATILRYNEEHEGKKLFIAGHADRAGDDAGNVKLSEHRAKAVLALVEGKKADYVAACGAKHSEVDVTQLFDWVNRQFNFTCKPTVMDRPPSDENYVKFRKSFNLWVKNGPAEGEKEPRGTEIGQYGRLQPDIWGAMFDLYEYNLRDELGEDSDGVATLRQGLTWVDGDKKAVGFGEKHPTTENAVDGMRSQADRRVEVLMFDAGEEPDLATTNGEDVYDGVTYQKEPMKPMVTARRRTLDVTVIDHLGFPLADLDIDIHVMGEEIVAATTDSNGKLEKRIPIGPAFLQLADGRFAFFGTEYTAYKQDPVDELKELPADPEGSLVGTDTSEMDSDAYLSELERLEVELASDSVAGATA